METMRFNHLRRTLSLTPTRRDLARALSGLAIGEAVASTRSDKAAAKKRKTCRPCQTKKKGKCRGNKPDDATCNGDGKCFAGKCVPRPTCLGYTGDCQVSGQCCSEICIAGQFCFLSNLEQPCLVQSDCSPVPVPLRCVAYQCRQP